MKENKLNHIARSNWSEGNMNQNAVRTVRKVGRPRPLKITTEKIASSPVTPTTLDPPCTRQSISDALNDLENLHIGISNGNYDENTARNVAQIYSILKSRGPELDASFKEQIDRYFVTLRNISREERLDMASRVRLLQVIELRAMKWQSNENLDAYYRDRIVELQSFQRNIMAPIPPPVMPTVPFIPMQTQVLQSSIPPLEPGEVLRSSGKFAKPTKVSGKNYFKDEIIIRNSDSGKVMGIKGRRVHMIEELSDTIISFQRVHPYPSKKEFLVVSPGARDRLVQITGPHEDAIGHAKLLVEDTIRRNASPVRDKRDVEDEANDNLNCFNQSYYEDTGIENFGFQNTLTHSLSMNNASLGKYNYSIPVGGSFIEVSGENADLVKEAKLVLEEYFTGQAEIEKDQTASILSPMSSTVSSFLSTDISRVNVVNKHQSLRQSNSLHSEVEEKSSSPFYSSSEDETKTTHLKSSHSTLFPNNVSSSTLCYSNETHIEEILAATDSGNSQSVPNPYACEKITYSREFLLNCAKLNYSHIEPKDFSRIAKEYPLICKEQSNMFDPEEYKEQWKSQILENSSKNEK